MPDAAPVTSALLSANLPLIACLLDARLGYQQITAQA
jgi:hypothetical protein